MTTPVNLRLLRWIPHSWVKGWMVGLICWFSAINEEYWILVSNGQYILRLINDGWFITWLEFPFFFLPTQIHVLSFPSPFCVWQILFFPCARLPLKLHLRPMSCSNPKCVWKSIHVLLKALQFYHVTSNFGWFRIWFNQKFHWWTHKLRNDPNFHYLTLTSFYGSRHRYTSASFVEVSIFSMAPVMFRPRSRVLDLETSLARRGAVGGRQRLGETVEDGGRHWPRWLVDFTHDMDFTIALQGIFPWWFDQQKGWFNRWR